jgi:hypothetical protein
VQTDPITSTARLLLELYGKDVVFDTPEKIDRFLAGADLLDKSHWRLILFAVGDMTPAADHHSLH